ncbi:MAG: 50S ribosomal protein L10 [Bacillota bacterium]|nr:50S ribosomal protein L10 [Bacillota bacterium]
MASQAILERKVAQAAALCDEIKSAQTLVVADHRGLTVAQDTEMRAELRKAGVVYRVVKNSLLQRAARDAGLDNMDDLFIGPSAIAYSVDDPIAPAKVIKQFADRFQAFQIKGGATEGRRVELERILQLATIPPVEVLHAQLVGGLVSPIAGLAMLLDAIREKAEETGAATAAEVAGAKAAKEGEEPATA